MNVGIIVADQNNHVAGDLFRDYGAYPSLLPSLPSLSWQFVFFASFMKPPSHLWSWHNMMTERSQEGRQV